MNTEKKNIAIVCQRFGKSINGGAEVHAYQVALQLLQHYNVTVLTSCAVDYLTWEPEFKPGTYQEDGINIIRFANETRSDRHALKYIRRKITGRLWYQRIYKYLGKPKWWNIFFGDVNPVKEDQLEWLIRQGPYIPSLCGHIRESNYDAVIGITMLYYPSAAAVQAIPRKGILVPTLHDEKASYYPVYKKVMETPEWLLFNTGAEEKLAHRLFHLTKKTAIAGVGIELIKDQVTPDTSVLNKLGIKERYLVYVGRIDKNKGCHILIQWFTRYLSERKVSCNLIMIGKLHMKPVEHPSVIYAGFLPDDQKTQLMLKAEALVIPSFYESLSLVLLESMACGVPVLANAKAEVLQDHIDKSGGGWAYNNYTEFKRALDELLADETGKKRKGQLGYNYVKENYSWEKILEVYKKAIEDVSKN
jgi:glycosyltransferase involved in cell wall biosynthesis